MTILLIIIGWYLSGFVPVFILLSYDRHIRVYDLKMIAGGSVLGPLFTIIVFLVVLLPPIPNSAIVFRKWGKSK